MVAVEFLSQSLRFSVCEEICSNSQSVLFVLVVASSIFMDDRTKLKKKVSSKVVNSNEFEFEFNLKKFL